MSIRSHKPQTVYSTIRFLESCSSSSSTEFLWFTSSGVGDNESLVVLQKKVFNFHLGLLVMELLVVGNQGLGNGHSDGGALGEGTTTSNSDSDGKILELVSSSKENWLEDLHFHGLWLDKVKWLTVYSNQTVSFLAEGNSGGILLSSEGSNLL